MELGPRFELDAPAESKRQTDTGSAITATDAHDIVLGIPVTLVTLAPDADYADREKFEVDAEALALVGSHPHVVTLHDRLMLDGDIEVLVTERTTTAGWTAGMIVDQRTAVRTIIKLAGAADAAHRAGQLHGAIEPAAIRWSLAGEPLLAGFALRPHSADAPVLHELSAHTAPELLMGEHATPATDVYGLGSTLYELLGGRAAFRGYDGESLASLAVRVLHDAVPALQVPGLAAELTDVVEWSLAAEPGQRPPSAAWLAEELGRVEGRLGWVRTAPQLGLKPGPARLRPNRTHGRHRTS